jgi:hypothetical protein
VLVDLFECIYIVFLKYRVSFRLDKCEFFVDRFEYVGHDITSDGNSPVQSKYDTIQDWPLPKTAKSLLSFVSLCSFYQRYVTWFEVGTKELRRMVCRYSRKAIPPVEWTETRVALFDSMKEALTSSPVMARFDSSTPVFLKTDWSASGMGCILMQPDGSKESLAAISKLVAGEDNEFDAEMTGARLRPVLFGSRKCDDRETHYHSMVGEAACGRWAFGKLKKYLYGAHFWWICDCDGMQILFGYDSPIKQLRRWGQEMLGYNCTLLHRSHQLMRDVDAINRRYEPGLIKTYMIKEAALHNDSRRRHPNSYAIPNLRYVNRHLAADPPHISDINAG